MNRYRLSIKGKNPNSFLKMLVMKKVKLFNIVESEDEVKITVLEEDYRKIIEMKTSYRISIINHYGFLKLKHLIKKYKFILIFLLFTLFIIIFLSQLIFSIEVVHQKEEIRQLVLQDLKEFGLEKYKFRVSYEKKEEIRNKILEKEKDKLEWLEIDNIGTKYIVNVEERLTNQKNEDNYFRNIVAKKDSMIVKIEASAGEIIRKKYDYVKKGDVLISGTIMNRDREVAKVKADGKVLGEVWYKVGVSLPKRYHEEIRTGNTFKALTIRISNKRISLPIKDKNKSYETFDRVLLKSNFLPFKLVVEENYELKIIDKKFTTSNAEKEALKLAIKSLKTKLKDEDVILNKKVLKKTINNSTIIVDVFFKVQEDITDYVKISGELQEGEESENSN
ncbi:MAG: sporulation protein YqfD [Bacilli bacterium]|nr:sporulation protein YqfD [Bacilli bacterium]